MPTESYFSRYPDFPVDVPVLSLPVISLDLIRRGSVKESTNTFDACHRLGFFLLDLSTCASGRELLAEAEEVFILNEKVHALPVKELEQYKGDKPSELMGYKGIGGTKIEDGRPDNVAFYTVRRDDVLKVDHARHINDLAELVFCILESHLRLERGTLASLNPPSEPSGTIIRLIRAHCSTITEPRTNMLGHTDLGTITMLFNAVGGLQVLPPGQDASVNENWQYIQPKPGCVIVNLGDTLVEWSGGVLRSNMHRVVTPPGGQRNAERYSVAVQIRPRKEASMKRLKSSVIPEVEEKYEKGGSGTQEMTDKDIALTAGDWEVIRQTGYLSGENRARSTGGTQSLLHTDEPLDLRVC